MSTTTSALMLPSKVYDVLKPVVQIVLPALAALYTGLAALWGFPYVVQVVGTITLVATFLGIVLGISSRTYNGSDEQFDGTLTVSKSNTALIHQLDLTTAPEALNRQKTLNLRVEKTTAPPPPLVEDETGIL